MQIIGRQMPIELPPKATISGVLGHEINIMTKINVYSIINPISNFYIKKLQVNSVLDCIHTSFICIVLLTILYPNKEINYLPVCVGQLRSDFVLIFRCE